MRSRVLVQQSRRRVSLWPPENRSLARFGRGFAGPDRRPFILLADLLHVVPGLGVGRHLVAKLDDGPLAGIVAREDEVDAVVELVQQLAQITRATRDVLRRIVRPPPAVARAGARPQMP